jgi:cyclophilin family peptidyl-prolyl cis-trans isomerase
MKRTPDRALRLVGFASLAGVLAVSAAAARKKPAPAAAQAPAAPTAADWRTPDPNNVLVIDTNKGQILVELYPQVAPVSTAQVRDLARSGFYDGRAFFRVIDGFMDQTGDPTDTGEGGSTKPNLPPEFTFKRDASTPMVVVDSGGGREAGFINALPVLSQPIALAAMTADQKVNAMVDYCPGVVGMARATDPASGNSQFFLMRGAHDTLNGKYTAIGRVIAGEDVVKSIKTGEPVPAPQDRMTKVQVLADVPAAQRPAIRVIDTHGPWFAAEIARVRAEKLIGISPCDFDIPSQVSPAAK